MALREEVPRLLFGFDPGVFDPPDVKFARDILNHDFHFGLLSMLVLVVLQIDPHQILRFTVVPSDPSGRERMTEQGEVAISGRTRCGVGKEFRAGRSSNQRTNSLWRRQREYLAR